MPYTRTAIAVLFTLLAWATPAAALDEALYAALLERHTRASDDVAGVRVDYAALQDSEDWERLIASLAATDLDTLEGQQARLALWINAYNILAIDLVRRGWPLESIRDLGGLFSPVWKRPAGNVGGRSVTLDEIEHGIVRPMGDPRVHAAVVCASTSCPSLRREPFTAERLDAQLDDATRLWLARADKGLRVDRDANTVWLSKIFDWFEEDFAYDGGVLAFAARYAPESERRWLEQNARGARLRYLDYDWEVNALGR